MLWIARPRQAPLERRMTDDTLTDGSLDIAGRTVSEFSFVIAKVASAYASKESSTVPEVLRLVEGLADALATAQEANRSHRQKIKASGPTGSLPDVPARPIENAVQNDKVICLCCGEPFTMLKRHLKAEHGLTVDEYRQKFRLPDNMPLVAPSYSARKAKFARDAGLGRHDRTG